MSLIAAAQWTAVATIALAAFAIVAAWYARRAFLKQSEEVRTLKDQLKDQQDLNAKQTPVLELQARELEASLAQRNDQAEAERRAQANRVAAWFALQEVPVSPQVFASSWGAIIRNDSDLPILDVRVSFHFIATASPASSEWRPVFRGSPAERVRVIPPHFEKFVEIPADVRNKHSEVSDDIYVVSFEFTDAAGNHWERDPRGALKDA